MATTPDEKPCRPTPVDLRKLVETSTKPLVFKNYLNNEEKWKCIRWGVEEWSKIFGHRKLSVRIGNKCYHQQYSQPQWESKCVQSTLTFDQLANWDSEQTFHVNCVESGSSYNASGSKNNDSFNDVEHFKSKYVTKQIGEKNNLNNEQIPNGDHFQPNECNSEENEPRNCDIVTNTDHIKPNEFNNKPNGENNQLNSEQIPNTDHFKSDECNIEENYNLIDDNFFNSDHIMRDKYWAYHDYKYMNEEVNYKQLKDISWDIFGYDRGLNDSVLWVGTKGANTPCHKDTYGYNLVAQLTGKKRWVLFPNTESCYLYPTRVPYEESSIYSKINFPYPNIDIYKEAKKATAYVVILEAGDVLYVPHHWWHFVECLEFSITINTWVESPLDHKERLTENFSAFLVGSLTQSITSIELLKTLLNPNMLKFALYSNQELLQNLLENAFDDNTLKKCLNENMLNNKEKFNDREICSNFNNIYSCNEKCFTCKESCSNYKKSDLSHSKCISNIDVHDKINLLPCSLCKEKIVHYETHKISQINGMPFLQYIKQIKDNPYNIEPSNPRKRQRIIAIDAESVDPYKLLIDSFTDSRVVNLLTEVWLEKLQSSHNSK